MGAVLRKRLLSKHFEGPHHEALLNVLLAGSHLRGRMDGVFAGADLTPTQFNVLRILNGVHPGGHPRGEIARRMLERSPDLTRLIDRLVRRGLVERRPSESDARQSIASITPAGRALLAEVHPRVRAVNREVQQRLTQAEARTLSRLCEKLYGAD